MKTRPLARLALLLAVCLSACAGGSDASTPAAATADAVTTSGVTADLTLQSDWGAGYCANGVITNASTAPVTSWTLVVALNQSTVSQQPWGATGTASGGQLTLTPVSYTATIAPGASVSFGFCGAATGSSYRPSLVSLAVVGGGSGGPTTYALAVTAAGTGSGTVTSSPSGIACGTTCSASYASGTTVTLTAAAASGSTFAGWGGACSGTGACVVTLSAAQAVTATFNTSSVTTYALSVTKSGSGAGTVTSSAGGISCGSTCSASYASGTAVTLTAAAASGSTFAGWSGACTGTGACIVTMTAAQSVAAAFTASSTGTAISISAGGSASGSFVADVDYSGGSTYSTTSTVDTSLLPSPVPPQSVLQHERYGAFTYTIPGLTAGGPYTVTLYFVESYWTAAGKRLFGVSINGSSVLSAFDIFSAAGSANKAVARSFNTTASSSGQVVIAFTAGTVDNPKVDGITVAPGTGVVTYSLNVSKAGAGSGTVSGGGIACGTTCSAAVASGTTVTLTAAAASGSTFGGWGGACSGTGSTCAVTVSAATNISATFNGSSGFNPCPTSGDCRILPLGDSITDGYEIPGGYRIPLFSTAISAGKHLTFVGSLQNGPTTVNGVTFPRNNEGHSGWTISQIAGLVPSPALNTPPNIVLLMAGTNDMYGSSSGIPAASQRLDALLGALTANAPNALIVVAKLTPLSDSGREALAEQYNSLLPAIVSARVAQGQHIVLVDMHTNFPTSNLYDGTHPNSAGYAQMASVWYAAIGSLLR